MMSDMSVFEVLSFFHGYICTISKLFCEVLVANYGTPFLQVGMGRETGIESKADETL
jgi:hypothetical protein